jgi:hypothetical protein
MQGVTVYRSNPKGIKGIWRCEMHLSESALKIALDPAIIAIDNALNGRKVN